MGIGPNFLSHKSGFFRDKRFQPVLVMSDGRRKTWHLVVVWKQWYFEWISWATTLLPDVRLRQLASGSGTQVNQPG